jgi:hypothetical protein
MRPEMRPKGLLPEREETVRFAVERRGGATLTERNRAMTACMILAWSAFVGHGGPGEYEYVKDTSQYVAIVRAELLSIGKLDAAGNFDPDRRYHNLDVHGGLSSCPTYIVLNKLHPRKERVYEYRSERLILGELDEKGNVVLALAAK